MFKVPPTILRPFDTPGSENPGSLVRLQRLLGVAGLVLIVATWKLWGPQQVYPQVPLLNWAASVPSWLEWGGLFLMVAALAGTLFVPFDHRCRPLLLWGFALSMIGLMLVDQHRLQPWAYQFVVVAIILATLSPRQARGLLCLFVVSIYVHSAISKLDYGFFESHGQQLLTGLLQNIDLSFENWSPTVRKWAAASLPVGELLVAIALCLPTWRRIGLGGSILMHIMMLAALGPWGLNHKPAVLIWNIYFILQNLYLFGPLIPRRRGAEGSKVGISLEDGTEAEPQDSRPPKKRWAAWAVQLSAFLVILLPLAEPWGYFDHWPSWGLYASRPGQAKVFIDQSERDRLPNRLQSYIASPSFPTSWCRLRIDRWSLEELNAPVYPQPRFQLGVALALAQKADLGKHIRVVIESPADRWTGKRSSREIVGMQALKNEIERFWLNAVPRENLSWSQKESKGG